MIAVLTCPRPAGARYVDAVLAAVDASTDGRRLLVCHGASEPARAGWSYVLLDRPGRGIPDNKVPGWAAIRAAADAAEDLLFLEDDVRPVLPTSIEIARRWRKAPGCGLASFHARGRQRGIHPGVSFSLSQAILIPATQLPQMASFPDFCPGDFEGVVGFDLALAAALRWMGLCFEQGPDLFEHVGVVSAARPA